MAAHIRRWLLLLLSARISSIRSAAAALTHHERQPGIWSVLYSTMANTMENLHERYDIIAIELRNSRLPPPLECYRIESSGVI